MKETFNVIAASLEGAGYTVSYEVCNARGLTAASRKRLYMVGLRKHEQGSMEAVIEEEEGPFQFPYVPDLGLRARDVLRYDESDLTPREHELLRITDEQLDRLCRETFWRPAKLAWPNLVCSTLVTHYGNSISRGHSQLIPCESGNPRRFTARECASLMGFPRDFDLPRKREGQGDMAHLKEQYRMFGNAVCPPMIAAIAGAVLARVPGLAEKDDWIQLGRTTGIHIAHEATFTRAGVRN
jgi:DNA (cytosine-5)-methyltransferase 1